MARAFLADHSGSEQVRAAMAADGGFDAGVWKRIASELGWCAVLVPEDCGGLGLGFVELAALLEVTGESLLVAPFFSTACVGAAALCQAGSAQQQAEHLPSLAEGSTLVSLAAVGPGGDWDPSGVRATYRADGQGFVLDGEARYVIDGCSADLLIVAARAEGTSGGDGIGLFLVRGDAPGLACEAVPTMDPTRPQATLRLAEVAVGAEASLGRPGEQGPVLRKILDLASVGLAAELVGVAQRCLDLAVDHAKERVQFGRTIGSFQSIKHKCADMMVATEAARSALYYAACVAAEDGDALPQAAALAKATASEAAFRCAADSMQIHGGVGFTWEYDVHLYLKRARAGESLFGTPAFHRERVAAMLLDGGS